MSSDPARVPTGDAGVALRLSILTTEHSVGTFARLARRTISGCIVCA